jgi:hypothetical protein
MAMTHAHAAASTTTTVSNYPPVNTQVATDKGVYAPGDKVTITASGFDKCAGQTITFTIVPPGGGTPIVVTATVGADGKVTITVTAPATIGVYTVTASSPPCPDAHTSFRVAKGGGIPGTGLDITMWVVRAAAVLFTGIGLVVVVRTRRRTAAAR